MKTMNLTLLAGLALSPMGWAQDSDPFATGGGGGDSDPFGTGRPAAVEVAPGAEGMTLTLEVFSVPMAKVAEMKRRKMNGNSFYEAVLEEVKAGKGTQDKLLEVRTVDGQTVTVEQVKEYIYATEYEPPEMGVLPAKLPEGFKGFDQFITPAMPTAFDIRNLGDTLEGTLNRSADHPGAIFGRVTFSHASLEGMLVWGEEESKVEMPNFSVQRINSAVNLRVNEPLMLGTLADPSVKPDKEEHVWLAFATVYEEEESGESEVK